MHNEASSQGLDEHVQMHSLVRAFAGQTQNMEVYHITSCLGVK